MKKQLTLLAVVVFVFFSSAFAGTYSGGTGGPNDPYLIATAEDMNEIGANSADWNKHFLLVTDINLADYTGTQFNIIGNFTGVFDGNDHTISNFTYDFNDGGSIGLFGFLDSGGRIKNLGLENVDVNVVEEGVYWEEYCCVGGLVGWSYRGTITNCYMTGNVRATGYYDGYIGYFVVGGLVGRNGGTIIDSYSAGNVSGNCSDTSYVGGLAGYNDGYYGTITNCYSAGDVNGTGHLIVVGGLVGKNNSASMSDCCSTGSVSGYDFVGGLVGCNYMSPISNCHSAANVKGRECVGGLTGDNSYNTITNCYATGSVSGDEDVGGLVGWNIIGTISNCYATGFVDGNDNTGGLVGINENHGTISNCYATGSVLGTGDCVGGLVGANFENSTISNCYAEGDVDGDALVGGLVGANGDNETIFRCYCTGSVSGDENVGGLAGYNIGTISNCYAAGSISGSYRIGGLVGTNKYWGVGSIYKCYSTGSVSGIWDVGGLIGDGDANYIDASFWDVNTSGQSTSDGGEDKTTVEMQTESTFTDVGWDFIDIWNIGENQTYPFLRVHLAGDINHDDIVNFYDLAILAGRWLQGAE
jgi:hypothetical protein